MRLTLYPTSNVKPPVRSAPRTRKWMDETPGGYAYRCLPLNMANGHGWEFLSTCTFEASWNGSPDRQGIFVQNLDKDGWPATSHFGSGIITFHVGYLVRTDPGYNLWVAGPTNFDKDGIIPLNGIVETDWSCATFTMNWRFTRPGKIRFERGEPFCSFFPIPRTMLDEVTPEIRDMSTDPDTEIGFKAWTESRKNFLQTHHTPGTEANKQGWQKHYFKGQNPNGAQAPEHQTKIRLNEPEDATS